MLACHGDVLPRHYDFRSTVRPIRRRLDFLSPNCRDLAGCDDAMIIITSLGLFAPPGRGAIIETDS